MHNMPPIYLILRAVDQPAALAGRLAAAAAVRGCTSRLQWVLTLWKS